MEDNLVHTLIAYPNGGHVLQKERGIASGDPWTSIVGSVVNYMILHTVYNPKFYKIFVFGDDSIIGYYPEGVPNIDVSTQSSPYWIDKFVDLNYATKILSNLYGITISVKKSYTCNISQISEIGMQMNDWTLCSQFLSNWFNISGLPVPRTSSVLQKLMYPERNKNSINWEKIRCISFYVQCYWNPVLREHIRGFFNFLFEIEPNPVYLSESDYHRLMQAGLMDSKYIQGTMVDLPDESFIFNLYVNIHGEHYLFEDYFGEWVTREYGVSD
jgi:hypothetical protein